MANVVDHCGKYGRRSALALAIVLAVVVSARTFFSHVDTQSNDLISVTRVPAVLISELESSAQPLRVFLDLKKSAVGAGAIFRGSSCGSCMTVFFNDAPIPPGHQFDFGTKGTLPLEVRFHPGKVVGARFHMLYFSETSSAGNEFASRIDYHIVPDCTIQPDVLSHTIDQSATEAIAKEIKLQWNRRRPIQLPVTFHLESKSDCSIAAQKVEYVNRGIDGISQTAWKLRLRFVDPPSHLGNELIGFVKIRVLERDTGDSIAATIRTLFHSGHVIEAPSVITFFDSPAIDNVKPILIRARDNRPFQIQQVNSTNPMYSVSFDKAAKSTSHTLVVTKAKRGIDTGPSAISIVTSRPEVQELTIRVNTVRE